MRDGCGVDESLRNGCGVDESLGIACGGCTVQAAANAREMLLQLVTCDPTQATHLLNIATRTFTISTATSSENMP